MSCIVSANRHQGTNRPVQSFSHVISEGLEHILVHRINKKLWAALNPDKELVPIAEESFHMLEDTRDVSFCTINENGLFAVQLTDMVRQVTEYDWTNGLAIQDGNVWNWDILKQEWIRNGLSKRMAIVTRCGHLLLPSMQKVGKSTAAKLCVNGHWNSTRVTKCRHCSK